MTTLPHRTRVVPVDRFAGVAPQFQRTDGGYFFRRHGWGPAVRVTTAERDAFVRAARWSIAIHAVALLICGFAGWLVVSRATADAGYVVPAVAFGVVLSLIAMALYGSLRWNADAPGRALVGRPVARPATDPDFADRPGYGAIVALTVFLLFMAAIGTNQPAAFYVTFATCSVMAGIFLAIRKFGFDRSLTPEQRQRAKAVARQEVEHARARHRGKPQSFWMGMALLFFVLLQMVALVGGLVLGFATVTMIAGTTAAQASGWTLVFAIGSSGIVAGLFGWIVERMCKRVTGESAIETLDFIPQGW